TRGKVVPLYPWNIDAIEVTDADRPPPKRIAARVILSPATAGGWPFGPQGGLETVVLLARRTPLGPDVRIGSARAALPPAPLRRRDELAVFGLDRGSDVSTSVARSRGTEEEALKVDQPLLDRLAELGEFELIRVVRFAHEGE